MFELFIIKGKANAYQGNLKPGLTSSGAKVHGGRFKGQDRRRGPITVGRTCLFEEAGEWQEGSPFISCKYIPRAAPPGTQQVPRKGGGSELH